MSVYTEDRTKSGNIFTRAIRSASQWFKGFFPENESDAQFAAKVDAIREEVEADKILSQRLQEKNQRREEAQETAAPANRDHVLDNSGEISTLSSDSNNFKDSGVNFSIAPAPSSGIDLSIYNLPLKENKRKVQFADVELKNENKSPTAAIRISLAADLNGTGDGRKTIKKLASDLVDKGFTIEPVISEKSRKSVDIGHNHARNEDNSRYNPETAIERTDSNGKKTKDPFYVEAYEVTVSGNPEMLAALKAGLEQASVKKFANTIKEKRNNLAVSR